MDMDVGIWIWKPTVIEDGFAVVVVPGDWILQVFGQVQLDSAAGCRDVCPFGVHLHAVQDYEKATRRGLTDCDWDRNQSLRVLLGGLVTNPALCMATRRHIKAQPDAVSDGVVQQI